jgi:hypothetical protein
MPPGGVPTVSPGQYPPTTGWPPPRAPERSRTPWIVALAGALTLLVAVLVVVAIWPGGDTGTGTMGEHGPSVGDSSAGGGAVQAAKSEGSPSPSANPNLDPCVVGTWRVTAFQATASTLGTSALFTSPGGATAQIWPDGREVDDYQSMVPPSAEIAGSLITEVMTGALTYHTETRDGRAYASEVTGTLTYTLDRDGVAYDTGTLTTGTEGTPYTCTDSTMRVYGDANTSTEVFTRVSTDPNAH